MAAPRIWIEAALNGPWTRARQPGIPVSIDEIIADGLACAAEGASIIHLHAYDIETGRQRDEWAIYAAIIEGIKAKADVIVYPTIPIAGSGFAGAEFSTSGRFAHLDELAKRGLVEWGVVDPGTVHLSRAQDVAAGRNGFVYLNPEEHVREGLEICANYKIRPSYAIYEPGFTRLGAALAANYPDMPTPVYRLMFSDEFLFGFPPEPYALEAHMSLLKQCAPQAPVMIAGFGVDVSPLIEVAVARGIHVRTGLEDVDFGATQTNAELVRALVAQVRSAGGEPANIGDVRGSLAKIDAT
jgi:3-keto-5-aminohexanoate cleavage enzyme